MIRYFVVETTDLTNDMIEKSGHMNNPYMLRKSIDESKVILKCHCDSVSVDLFKLGLTPIDTESIQAYLLDETNGFTEDNTKGA